jgi:hypothetical protein
LGVIDPVEEIGLSAHLDGCPSCRAELRDLTAVADALEAVPVTEVITAPAEPSGALGSRVLERVAHERDVRNKKRTRRIVAGAGVGALVAIAAAIAAIVLAVGGGTGAPATQVALRSAPGVHATASLRTQNVGTAIDMKLSGLDPHQYYWLWVTDDEHNRMAAGTFRGSDQQSDVRFSAAVPLDEARRIWVTDEKKRVVLDASIPAPA